MKTILVLQVRLPHIAVIDPTLEQDKDGQVVKAG